MATLVVICHPRSDSLTRAAAEHPLTVSRTFLGAHEVPAEYRPHTDRYVDHLIAEMLPAVVPWCESADVFAEPKVFDAQRSRRILQMFIEVLFAAALVLIAVQLYDGIQTIMRRRSTTFLLQYPLWWNYAAAFVPAAITAVIAVWMALVRIAEALTNRSLIPVHGAEH